MAIQAFITHLSAVTQHVILAWYTKTAPNAEIASVTLPHPNVDGEETTVAGLQPDNYIFRFFLSSNGSTKDSLYDEVELVVREQNPQTEYKHYKVDGGGQYDPVDSATTLTDPAFLGKSIELSQRGFAFINPVNYSFSGSTITLLGGATFVHDDEYTVIIKGSQNAGASVSNIDYQDIHPVSANETFGAAYKTKHNVSAFSANSTGVTTFPDFLLIADTRAKFSTYDTDARYWRLQFATGNTVKFLGQSVNAIVLRQDCMLELGWKNNVCYVLDYKGTIALCGTSLLGIQKIRGTEYADGSEHDIVDYQDTINRLPTAYKVSYDDWAITQNKTVGDNTISYKINRAKFAVDTNAGKFRFPDLRDLNFKALSTLDGSIDPFLLSQGVGGMSPQELMLHGHPVATTGGSINGVSPGRTLRRTNVAPVSGDVHEGEGDGYIIATGGVKQMIDSANYLPLIWL